MKRSLIILILFCAVFAAACRAPGGPVAVTRVLAVPTAVSPTTQTNIVEVTRVVIEVPHGGTAEPTATPAPCTPLPDGMRLTISMAEQERTVLLDTEGLLPEDKPIVLLNGRSSAYSKEMTRAVGPDGRLQETLYLGEDEGDSWSGQIIHQRGAACFEFTFPLTEPVVLEGTAPTPKPTTTPLPLPTPTITPIPTTLATRTIEATATDCPIPEMLAQNELDLAVPDCIVWLDNFDNETGFIVRLGYPRSGDWFLYYTPANVTAMHIPAEDAPRLMESAEQCSNRQSIVVEVTAVLPDGNRRFADMGLDTECDLRQLPTATAVPPQETTWTTYQSDALQLALQHPATWTAEERDGILYLMSPERYPLGDGPQQLVYYIYSSAFPNPEQKPFEEVVTADLSPELQQIFSYTTETIVPYTVYRTTHMPSADGALTVFFAAEDRFVSLALTPHRSEDPFEAQEQYVQLFEQMLDSVQLLNDE